MKETPDEVVFGLTDEEYIKNATSFFERTLNGLGRDDEYKISITRDISFMGDTTYFGESRYSVSLNSLRIIPADVVAGIDKQFDTLRDALRALALCACQFTLHYAERELSTRPDEQGWMAESMAYWHKLKDEVIEFKEHYLK
jgi:hypothetical protein